MGARNASFPGDSTGYFPLKSYRAIDFNAGVFNDRWTIRLFARNLADERAYVTAISHPPYFEAAVLEPRTVGVDLDVKF